MPLSGSHEKAAMLLAAGRTIRGTARACQISESVIYKWLKKVAFTKRIDALRALMLEAAMGRLTNDMTRASGVLRRLLEHADGRLRLNAAKTILESAARLRETVAMDQRLKALEGAEA